MSTALLVAAKDLRLRLRDRSVILMGLVVPLGLAWVFSLILADVTGGGLRFTYAVADADGGPLAGAFTDQVLGGMAAQGFVEIHEAVDEADARRLVEAEEVTAAFVIPAGFSAAITAGQGAEIEVVTNPGSPTGGQVARSVAIGFAAELTYTQAAVGTVLLAGVDVDPAALAQGAGGVGWPVQLEPVEAADQELDPATYLSAGMAVFFLFFAVQAGVTGIMEERENGTLMRLLAAPVPRAAVYTGKLLTSLLIGLLSMSALVVFTSLLLGAEWGAPAGVAVLVVAGVLAAVAIQAVIGTIARTAEQAAVWQTIVAIVLGMVGGAFFQVTIGPALLSRLSLLTPHQWFLRGLGDLRTGEGVAGVLPEAGALLVFAAVAGVVALLRLRRMAQL
jgi:ABC-2 type transport system permease protein